MGTCEFKHIVLGLHIFMMIIMFVAIADSHIDNDNSEKLSLEAALKLRTLTEAKKTEFKKTKQEALKYIPKEVRPGKLIQEGNFTSVIMEYDGNPMPLYIILIALIPLVLAELCRLLWNLIRPRLRFQQEGGGEFPFTACYHLQETLREQSLKRPARNCTSWFVHQYILSIEDETLEWKDVIESLQVPQPIRKKKPWQTIRLIFRLKNALKKVQHREEDKMLTLDRAKPILAGNHIECHLRTRSSEDTLHLENQISQLELYYKTLNTLEKDYEVPAPPHPELFTVRELMEFMTRDEKLLVLRCFDKSQMNDLMINCNIEEIRKKNAEFVQAHMQAAASVYEHVEDMKSKASVEKKESTPQVVVEKEKSIQTLFDIKDRLAKDIVEANDKLLQDWENSEEQNEVKENMEAILDPIHIKRAIMDDNMEPEEMLDNFALNQEPEELKVKPLTSEERVEHLIQQAEYDIGDLEKRIEVKKKIRKKGKGKTTKLTMKKKNLPAVKEETKKAEVKAEVKTPYKWLRSSGEKDDLDKTLGTLPKLKHEPVHKLKDRKGHVNLHKANKKGNPEEENDNLLEEKKSQEGIKNEPKEKKRQRKSADDAKEKEQGVKPGNEAGQKGKRKESGNETENKRRRISDNEPEQQGKRKSSGEPEKQAKLKSLGEPVEKEKRKISGEPVEKEKRKSSGEPVEKEKRKISGEPVEKEKRKSSGEPVEKEKRKSSGEPVEKETRKSSGEPVEKETRKSSGEPVENEKRKSSGEPVENEKRKSSGEPGDKEPRKGSAEPGEKEKRKSSGNESGGNERRKPSGEPAGKEKRKSSGEPDDKETRKSSGNESGEKESRKPSGETGKKKKRRSSGNERDEKERRKVSEEPGEKERRKSSGHESEQRKPSGEPREKEKRKTSKNEDAEKQRRISDAKDRENERRKTSGNQSGDEENRKTSDSEGREKERRRSSQKRRREQEQRRISDNERVERERRRLSEKDDKGDRRQNPEKETRRTSEDDKQRKISETDIGIQTHHHHHHKQNMPTLMLDQYRKNRYSGDENEDAKYPEETEKDIHAVHDDTVDAFFQQTKNKEITNSAAMAIQRDLIFQDSTHHPNIKIYSQGRRAQFDALKGGKLPNVTLEVSGGDGKTHTDEEKLKKTKK